MRSRFSEATNRFPSFFRACGDSPSVRLPHPWPGQLSSGPGLLQVPLQIFRFPSLTGKNFQNEGCNDTFVRLWNGTSGSVIVPGLISVSPTTIIGIINIPANADPSYNLNVTTVDGGTVMKPNAFATTRISPPTVSSVTPAIMYQGTTAAFTTLGSNFQSGGRTTVNLTNASGYTITATLSGIYPAAITGTVNVPSGGFNGSWKANVTTLDGGAGAKSGTVTIL